MQGQHHAPQQNVPWHQWRRQNPEIWWSLMIIDDHWFLKSDIAPYQTDTSYNSSFPRQKSSINITLTAPWWDPEICWTYDRAPTVKHFMGHLWQTPPGF
jgi:hypothetical protein